MGEQPTPHSQVLARFLGVADELVGLVGGLSDDELDLSRAPGQWSIRQIVHHLADDGDVWSMCIKKALATPGAVVRFEGFPGNEPWAEALDFGKRAIAPALHLILSHRQYVADVLHDLDGWENTVKLLDAAGVVQREISAGEMVEMLTSHMATHVATIQAICEEHGIEQLWFDEDDELLYEGGWDEEDDDVLHEEWLDEYGETEFDERPWLDRVHLLAAETFGYSYQHYWDHLVSDHVRFVQMMPDDIEALARAEAEGWTLSRLARALELPEDAAERYQRAYREAVEIVDAPSPAASFRRGVHASIRHAIDEGLDREGAVGRLVTQIGYRAADLGFLLDMEGGRLSDFTDELKEESARDRTYWAQEPPGTTGDEPDEPEGQEDD
jgi:hypothetical protein